MNMVASLLFLKALGSSITDDGIFVYTFEGWYLGSINGQDTVGQKYKITSDVHLHARWKRSSTLSNVVLIIKIKLSVLSFLNM